MIIRVVPLLRLPVGIGPFSYAVDDASEISVGVVVQIPFRSKTKLGIVVAINTERPAQAVQPIISMLAQKPLVSPAWCQSLLELAAVYHVNPSTLSLSMLPSIGPRMITDKTLSPLPHAHSPSTDVRHLLIDAGADLDATVQAHVQTSTLPCVIICPDTATVERLARVLQEQEPCIYNRAGSSKEAKRVWHLVRSGAAEVVIGTRAAAFLPFAPRTAIVVVHPQDDGHTQWDAQPHTTTLDVLAVRARHESISVTTLSHTATTQQLLEKNAWVRTWNPTPLRYERIDNAQLVRARLYHTIPEPVRDAISHATAQHPAVLLVNRTDASVVLRCADCETVIASRDTTICPQCRSTNLLSRGMTISSLAREAQQQFPELLVAQLHADQTDIPPDAHIIVGTDAVLSSPMLAQASVVWVACGDARFSRPWYCAVEDALYFFRELAARAPHAQLLVSTWNAEHPLWSALQDTNALRRFFAAELQSRKKHGYPPYVRLIRITHSGLPTAAKSAITNSTELLRLHPNQWIKELAARTSTFGRETRVEPYPLST